MQKRNRRNYICCNTDLLSNRFGIQTLGEIIAGKRDIIGQRRMYTIPTEWQVTPYVSLNRRLISFHYLYLYLYLYLKY